MKGTLRKIGNSRGIIIPNDLIRKYRLERVNIRETDEGILLVPVDSKDDFSKKLEQMRIQQSHWLSEMKKAAEDENTQKYYRKESEEMGDVDIEILE
jgi:antitoxin component of MazEF toxin-antitoxin module